VSVMFSFVCFVVFAVFVVAFQRFNVTCIQYCVFVVIVYSVSVSIFQCGFEWY